MGDYDTTYACDQYGNAVPMAVSAITTNATTNPTWTYPSHSHQGYGTSAVGIAKELRNDMANAMMDHMAEALGSKPRSAAQLLADEILAEEGIK